MKKPPPSPKRSRNKAPAVEVPKSRVYTIRFVDAALAPIKVTGDGICTGNGYASILSDGWVVAVIPVSIPCYVVCEVEAEVPPPAVPEQVAETVVNHV